MPVLGDEGEDTTVSMGSERAGVELARVSSSAPSGAETVGVVLDGVRVQLRGGIEIRGKSARHWLLLW